MKASFVYYDATAKSGNTFMVGISIISSMLKKAGHKTSLIHISRELEKEEFQEKVKKEDADVYLFTSISLVYPRIKKYAAWLKEIMPKKMIVVGGVHAILNPEECIEDFDAVCIGEGEYCTLELVNKLASKKPIYSTKNFWFKKNSKIIKNERLPLIENLDLLPFPDREMWDYYNLTDYMDAKQITIMASRGCPYMCSYCFNHKIRELYSNKHKWVRFRSVKNVIQEIKEVIEKYPGDYNQIRFIDDTLIQDKKWFEEFCKEFPKLKLGISCQARANEINEETARKLKNLGVKRIELGVESGNEFIRNKIMKRYMTNEQIITAFNLFEKYGIQTTSFNILGLPFETIEMMLDTVKINVLAKSTWQNSFLYQPFPNTESWRLCKEYGFLTEKTFESLFEGSPLDSPHFKEEEAKFIQLYFRKLVKLYKIKPLWPLYDFLIIRKLIPFKTLNRLGNFINWTDYLSEHHTRLANKLKKLRFWKK